MKALAKRNGPPSQGRFRLHSRGRHCAVQFVDPLIYPPLFDPNVVQFVVIGAGRTGWGCGGGAETALRKLAAR